MPEISSYGWMSFWGQVNCCGHFAAYTGEREQELWQKQIPELIRV